jgi:hypothetical protein
MNFEDLNKDKRIKSTIKHLADRFGDMSFKIKDHWGEDLNAIGFVGNGDRYLVYISTYGDNDFFVSLENLETKDDHPYEPVGDFNNLSLETLEKIFMQHLRLETTDAP